MVQQGRCQSWVQVQGSLSRCSASLQVLNHALARLGKKIRSDSIGFWKSSVQWTHGMLGRVGRFALRVHLPPILLTPGALSAAECAWGDLRARCSGRSR
mmetsp:Transcript_130600/g.338515  ORF Transcript_130600/g.338515 Transcript_130600/m.338515 type:complete len:99 (-) Transcript_130600:36-332(-)